MMGFWVAGLFFIRSWMKTQDRLLGIFGLAFWILAVERIVLLCLGEGSTNEYSAYIYCMRLLAFIMILIGIIDKNRR